MTALDLTDAVGLLSSREASPVELVQATLERVEALDDAVHAFVTLTADAALDAARTAADDLSAGRSRGPLHGVPFVAKDLFDSAGVETSAGSRVLAGRVPDTDSTCLARLRDSGAIPLGKVHGHEFAYGVTTPAVRNPLHLDRTAGGSSGGSAAAVAAGYCALSLGTDTAGSIRIPAAACGVVGLRPTYGRVSTAGVIPLAWSFDTAGPICRTARDAALMLTAVAGFDETDPTSSRVPPSDYVSDLERGIEGMKIGVPTDYFFDNLDPDVEDAVRRAVDVLDEAGADVREVSLPMADTSVSTLFAVCLPEASEAHSETFPRHADLYGDDVRLYLELGVLRPGTEYVRAQRIRAAMAEAWRQAFDGLSAVVAPTLPAQAAGVDQAAFDLPHGAEDVTPAYLRLNAAASLVGLPALSVPCHRADDRLPIGLQIIGRPFDEATVLRIGRAVEVHVGAPRLPLDPRLQERIKA